MKKKKIDDTALIEMFRIFNLKKGNFLDYSAFKRTHRLSHEDNSKLLGRLQKLGYLGGAQLGDFIVLKAVKAECTQK